MQPDAYIFATGYFLSRRNRVFSDKNICVCLLKGFSHLSRPTSNSGNSRSTEDLKVYMWSVFSSMHCFVVLKSIGNIIQIKKSLEFAYF